MTEAEQERAKVVAWLRRQANTIRELRLEASTDASRVTLAVMAGARDWSADAIERGEHLKEREG